MIKNKKDLIKSLATHAKEVGSTEIQIGLLTWLQSRGQRMHKKQKMN